MKNVIYYCTSTGNTLAVARDLAAELGDRKLIPIYRVTDQPEVVADAAAVGNFGVRWGSSCNPCYTCIHGCLQGAVEIGSRTTGKPRYHHPEVALKDMPVLRGGS